MIEEQGKREADVMLSSKGFDDWAGEYDETIAGSKGYPFDGYYRVLGFIQSKVRVESHTDILDVGVGTGLLTNELYKKGGKISGIDFSENMLALAQEKMPTGNFYLSDFRDGLPIPLAGKKFDYIVSSYALHHLQDADKIEFIIQLKTVLKPGGCMLLADIAFENLAQHDDCRKSSGDQWDDEEFYIIADRIIPRLIEAGCKVEYVQISSCAGAVIVQD